MCVLMGLLAEMIMRTFYESQGKSVYLVRATRNLEASPPAAAPRPTPSPNDPRSPCCCRCVTDERLAPL